MNYKRALIPVAAVALVCGGVVAAFAATTSTQVTCPQHPAASGGQYSFVCTTTHPKSTETFHGVVPQPTPTPSSSASPSSSPTPTFSATPNADNVTHTYVECNAHPDQHPAADRLP